MGKIVSNFLLFILILKILLINSKTENDKDNLINNNNNDNNISGYEKKDDTNKKYNFSKFNLTNLISICENFESNCYELTQSIINETSKQYSISSLYENSTSLISLIISESYYYYGLYNYYGINLLKNDLEVALSSFIISSYLGNPKSQYKLYIIISTDLISHIINTNKYKNILNKNVYMNYIYHTKFYANFNSSIYANNPSVNEAISLQFLYSSALAKYNPALLTLGNKFKNSKNCESAMNYYKQSAYYSINSLFNKTNMMYYYHIFSLENYEYIKNKIYWKDGFNIKVEELIDGYKIEKNEKAKKKYIPEIALRYLVGLGTSKSYENAYSWFKLGESYNDDTSLYFLAEMYLNGWGVEIDYKKAYELLVKSSNLNNYQADNSLGYMYYYGYYVKKDVNKAYDYFLSSITKEFENEALLNIIVILLENNKEFGITTDFNLAYHYANFISLKGHKYGSYFFAMMNKYKIGSLMNKCDINLMYFKDVAEKNYDIYSMFNYAINFYKNKKYSNSLLMFLEMAEQGIDKGIINTGILLKKYNIFKDKNYQKFLFFKYTKIAADDYYNVEDLFSMINLGDFYFYNKNFSMASLYYKNAIRVGKIKNDKLKNKKDNNFNFYIANAYFNMGYMINFAYGFMKNNTKALYAFNMAKQYESVTGYPIAIIQFVNFLNDMINHGKIFGKVYDIICQFFQAKINIFMIIILLIFIVYFLVDIYSQN